MTELCREIYWNIGHGAKVLVPMFLVTLPALALVVGAIIERRKIYLQGRPLQRLDRLSDRIDILFRNVMLQRKVVRGSGAGTAHGLFFWGFFLLRSGRINIERVNMVTATGQPVLVSNLSLLPDDVRRRQQGSRPGGNPGRQRSCRTAGRTPDMTFCHGSFRFSDGPPSAGSFRGLFQLSPSRRFITAWRWISTGPTITSPSCSRSASPARSNRKRWRRFWKNDRLVFARCERPPVTWEIFCIGEQR